MSADVKKLHGGWEVWLGFDSNSYQVVKVKSADGKRFEVDRPTDPKIGAFPKFVRKVVNELFGL